MCALPPRVRSRPTRWRVEDAARVLVMGAGVQARLQLRALALVRPLVAATYWARDPEKARDAAREMAETLGIPVAATTEPATAAAEADIIVTTTPATGPILFADWLRPGQHVTAMGSDAEHKNEIDPAVIPRVRYVADRLSQTRVLGELRAALSAGAVAEQARFPELGGVLAGLNCGPQRAGRDHARRSHRHGRAGHRHRHPCRRPCPCGGRGADLHLLNPGSRRCLTSP
jgi:ornithine cyclodeaminase